MQNSIAFFKLVNSARPPTPAASPADKPAPARPLAQRPSRTVRGQAPARAGTPSGQSIDLAYERAPERDAADTNDREFSTY